MKKHSPEYERFDCAMGELLKVPHSEIKAKLEAEKRSKEQKKKRKTRASASGRASDAKV